MKLISSLLRRNGDQCCSATVKSDMDFSDEQRDAIKQLKKRVSHKVPKSMDNDYEYYKWLQAKNFDICKAEEMIDKTLVWRKQWDVDTLLKWEPPEVLEKYNPVGLSGYDNEGSPVFVIPFGGCDIRGLLQSCSAKEYIKYQLYVLENSLDLLRKKYIEKGSILKQVCIFDMENYSMKTITWKPARDALLQLVQMYESNYPELLKCCYVVNTPRIFSVAMALVKPFVQPETLEKIKLFGTSGWKEVLLQTIPADQLPVHWGGTQCDPDGNPKCPSKICLGGEVPQSYYLKNKVSKSERNAESAMQTRILPNGGKETVNLQIDIPATTLKWEFYTEDFDVGFGICRLLPSGEQEIILAPQRVNCQVVPEEGSLYCVDPGTYEVTFDNEYSYLRSKKLFYNLEVIPPSDTTKF